MATQCECNCGAVAFEILSPLSDIYVCHCSICRRFTGGAGIPVIVIRNDQFKWLRGQDNIRIWSKPDADWDANFCATCGSSLPGKNDEERMFIPAGLLPSEFEGLKVGHHIFVDSKARWDVICDDGKQHKEAFSG